MLKLWVWLVVFVACAAITGCEGSDGVGPSPEQEAIAICESETNEAVPGSTASDARPALLIRYRQEFDRCMGERGYAQEWEPSD